MKLYFAPGSCSLSPHIALREAGLDFELVRVDIRTHTFGDGQDYYRINELGYVPVLQIDSGEVFREGATLVQYIADQAPESGLAPANGTLERYQLQEWLNFLSTEIHKGFVPLFYGAAAEGYANIAKAKLLERFQWIDAQLASKEYLMGDRFTIADGYLFALTGWAKAAWMASIFNIDVDLTGLNNLAAWHQRVSGRPTVQAALKAEGLHQKTR